MAFTTTRRAEARVTLTVGGVLSEFHWLIATCSDTMQLLCLHFSAPCFSPTAHGPRCPNRRILGMGSVGVLLTKLPCMGVSYNQRLGWVSPSLQDDYACIVLLFFFFVVANGPFFQAIPLRTTLSAALQVRFAAAPPCHDIWGSKDVQPHLIGTNHGVPTAIASDQWQLKGPPQPRTS